MELLVWNSTISLEHHENQCCSYSARCERPANKSSAARAPCSSVARTSAPPANPTPPRHRGLIPPNSARPSKNNAQAGSTVSTTTTVYCSCFLLIRLLICY